jgi:hypothetical protein
MRSFLPASVLLAAAACGPAREDAPPGLRVAYFQSDATPPVGSPVFGKPIEVIQEPLLLKGILLEDRGTRYVLAALDWCTTRTRSYAAFRRRLAEAAGTAEPHVAVHCVHTHSAPFDGDVTEDLLERATSAAAAAVRDAAGRMRGFTHVGVGRARVDEFASNRRVPGPDGKIRVRYSATKDPSLRAEPEGLVDPFLRTVAFFDGPTPLVRLHYYASHPQSFYRDGRAHPDTPGWARARLEKEEGLPHVYFTGCGGNVTAGKYNDGSPEARARLIDRLADGMRRASFASNVEREEVRAVAWKVVPVRLPLRPAPESDAGGFWPAIELSRLTLGPAEILHLPGEPFVEYQLFAQALRPDRFVCVAGYGDGGPGYICTDAAYGEGGYEPTASRVGPPVEGVLKRALTDLLR